LPVNGLDDRSAVVADIYAPETGQAIKEAAVILIDQKTSITGLDEMRSGLMHIGVMREGVKVELTIKFTQVRRGGVVVHEEIHNTIWLDAPSWRQFGFDLSGSGWHFL
jgi:hypothetical protein